MKDSETKQTAIARRLAESDQGWKVWGPYLPSRQWGTGREDYSTEGDPWTGFPYEEAKQRVYRWGEDGILGWCDEECRLILAPVLWNGKDDHLKERLFGLSGPEGNHGEDLKEIVFHLKATPTHCYAKARYRYPIEAFPYQALRSENASRTPEEPEYDLLDTGILQDSGFFDLDVEYAKLDPSTALIRYTITNQSEQTAALWFIPQLWFRNDWAWGRTGSEYGERPEIRPEADGLLAQSQSLGRFKLRWREEPQELLFTENEDDSTRGDSPDPERAGLKDAFHQYLVAASNQTLNQAPRGSKAGLVYRLELAAGESRSLDLTLAPENSIQDVSFQRCEQVLRERIDEHDEFYRERDPGLSESDRRVWLQAYASLLWSKRFYWYNVAHWLEGEPARPAPPRTERKRNLDWCRLDNRAVILLPDPWEYPWYAAWDHALHALAVAPLDLEYAQEQLLFLLSDNSMHSTGQIPAYELDFSEASPPLHSWACLRLYQRSEQPDIAFLEKAFHRLLLNFTWWLNRTDIEGDKVDFSGSLGLDNIGVFNRTDIPPELGKLHQSDGVAWVAFHAVSMFRIALEIAQQNPVYESIALRLLDHFLSLARCLNLHPNHRLWDEQDQFYYDRVLPEEGDSFPLRVRSAVGLLPLLAVTPFEKDLLAKLPNLKERLEEISSNSSLLSDYVLQSESGFLLTLAGRERTRALLRTVLDPAEFLSPFGLRSLSYRHRDAPYRLQLEDEMFTVEYEPGESESEMMGGNSNWRGPVWMPLNYLLVDALRSHQQFFGDGFKLVDPEGVRRSFKEAAQEIERRFTALFRETDVGKPAFPIFAELSNPELWKEGLLFHEYFHADTGRGLGADHQTGWTALLTHFLERDARESRSCSQVHPEGDLPQGRPSVSG